MITSKKLGIGLPRMHLEPGERRDFLPDFVAFLGNLGWEITLENEYGSGVGLTEKDYLDVTGQASFGVIEEVYSQDYVLVLRYPGDKMIKLMRPGACLISMLHYPTRPDRVEFLNELGCVPVPSTGITGHQDEFTTVILLEHLHTGKKLLLHPRSQVRLNIYLRPVPIGH